MTELSTLQDEASEADVQPADPSPPQRARFWSTVRPFAFTVAIGAVLLAVSLLGPEFNPGNPLVRYGLRVSVVLGLLAGLAAIAWCRRSNQTWDADLIAAMWSGLGGLTMIVALRGTPFGPLGVFGDQSFRTEYLTRLTDTWQISDYFYQNRPGYYAPGFFWVLGRTADLLGVEGWRMMKVAAILGPILAPLILYLFWRRHLDARIAALLAGVALIMNDFYEPYGWFVMMALIPWLIEVFYGPQRPGAKPWHPAVLGLIGGIMFSIYYYYFFVIPFFFLVHIAYSRWVARTGWGLRDLKRPIIVLALAALFSSFFWLPLAWEFLTAGHFESLNNRWLVADHGDLELSMLHPSVVGLLTLGGLIYLVLTARTRVLSRALLMVVVAAYAWHVAGFFLAASNHPVMSFRMKVLIPLTLMCAAIVALTDLMKWAVRRFDARQATAVGLLIASLLAVYAGDRYVSDILGNDWIRQAHSATLPDGSQPKFADPKVKAITPAAEEIRQLIDKRFPGPGHPVLLCDRIDVMAFYPYYGFVQWNSSYSHPTAEFANRVEFLTQMQSVSPAEFAERTANNPYDRIDAFVLSVEGDTGAFYYSRDNYPSGATTMHFNFPLRLFDPQSFEVTRFDNLIVAIRK